MTIEIAFKVIIAYMIIGVCFAGAFQGVIFGEFIKRIRTASPKNAKTCLFVYFIIMSILWVVPVFQVIIARLKDSIKKS